VVNNGAFIINRSDGVRQGTDFPEVISGTGGIAIAGSGTVTFAGGSANTASGLTTVSSGGLTLSKSVGVNSITGNVSITGTGILTNGNGDQISDAASVTINGTTCYWNINGQEETVANVELQASNLANGSGLATGVGGSLIVAGAFNHTGGQFTLNSGGSGASLNANAFSFTGGVFLFGSTSASTQRLVVGPGGFTLGSGVNFRLNSSATCPNSLTLGGNLTSLASATSNQISDTASALGILALNGNRTFNVEDGAAASDLTISARIANGTTPGGIGKSGLGTLTLSGNNTYTGATTVSAGTLALAGSHASPITSGAGAAIQFTLNDGLTPVAVSSSTLTLNASSTVKIIGTPSADTTYTLMTSSGITGTPVLATAITGFALVVEGTDLKLKPAAAGDTIAPGINLSGSSPVTVNWGGTYTDAGATATDNVDSSVTVNVSGTVNTAKPGAYTLTYTASDVAGNVAVPVTRTVNVVIANPTTVGVDGYTPLMRYALGATSPTGSVQPPMTSATASELSITAVVRTDDANLTVSAETNTDLTASGGWTGSGITVTNAADQSGVPSGCVRKVFTVSISGASKKFIRIKAVSTI
jgi:autotransporter-associated beta strand protein